MNDYGEFEKDTYKTYLEVCKDLGAEPKGFNDWRGGPTEVKQKRLRLQLSPAWRWVPWDKVVPSAILIASVIFWLWAIAGDNWLPQNTSNLFFFFGPYLGTAMAATMSLGYIMNEEEGAGSGFWLGIMVCVISTLVLAVAYDRNNPNDYLLRQYVETEFDDSSCLLDELSLFDIRGISFWDERVEGGYYDLKIKGGNSSTRPDSLGELTDPGEIVASRFYVTLNESGSDIKVSLNQLVERVCN